MFRQFGSGRHCGPGFGFRRFHHGWSGEEFWSGRGAGRRWGPPGGGRRFGRGDLKYIVLDLLKDQPRHGYDIIRALEERSHGFYSPSPGSVYPTLQLLEDQGYVTSTEQDGKKVYAITDAGRSFLSEQQGVMEGIRERMGGPWGGRMNPEMRQLMQEMAGLGQFLFRQGAQGGLNDPEKVRRLREVVARTRSEIEGIFSNASSSSSPSPYINV
jgi:DNA-binding PadR family transcriptional regulator